MLTKSLPGCGRIALLFSRCRMAPTLDFRNTNSLWCSVLVETLVRCGVRHAVCSPGSRSTALTVALAAHPSVDALPVLDERSAGFIALGLAKRTRRPVVLVCTSGSAAANYWPAVVEAQAAQLPLVVVTADRPPEMRGCTSGQTIDQLKLYGTYVQHAVELAVPEANAQQIAYLRQTVAFAALRSAEPVSGPVHLNAPFRDPLPPVLDGSTDHLRGVITEAFFAHLTGVVSTRRSSVELEFSSERGVIVAGTYAPGLGEDYEDALISAQRATGWPILADPLSPARRSALLIKGLVTTYDSILRSPAARNLLRPSEVLCLGAWPTSKVLRGWMQECGAEITVVAPEGENRDALHGRTRHILARPGHVAYRSSAAADNVFLSLWMKAEEAARAVIDGELAARDDLFEPKAIWLLSKQVAPKSQIFVANSMPIRDAEYVTASRGDGPRLFCNRGANGIDGNVSSALGLAHDGPPTFAVVGDLAFFHDSNALLSVPRFRGNLTLVVINNDGGGIFEHLPIATSDVPFRDFFLTPQSVDVGLLCQAHRVPHQAVSEWSAFERELAHPQTGVRVLELRTNGKRDAAERKALFSRAAERVTAVLEGRSQ
ncbi:MAG: 2-succinyl-5-enolpyruvyl-6-hydroxy-3-cyclohexene-1-carboxylic-acid synthase [Opitutaceae bacterium]|nr:2-succinyl-5-enolpyruvyl-6-hydroxy-3-cyclohexene-1-carboxylic-acid synthase [Opitutaceae bacterium]